MSGLEHGVGLEQEAPCSVLATRAFQVKLRIGALA